MYLPAQVFFPRTRAVKWVLRIRLADQDYTNQARREFTSLSQMVRAFALNPVPDDAWVVLERNGQLIYRGFWGEVLRDAPTVV